MLEDCAGDLGDVGALPTDDQERVADGAGGHFAVSLCVGVGGSGSDALIEEKLADLLDDVVVLEDGYGTSEVLDGVEGALLLCYADADDGEAGIEDVGAVDGGAHPLLFDGDDAVAAVGDVLCDGGEVGTGHGGAGGEVGFAGVLVGETALLVDDPVGMDAGGVGECGIPREGSDAVLGAALIGEFEEGLLGGGWALLGDGWGDEGDEAKEQDETSLHGVAGPSWFNCKCLLM